MFIARYKVAVTMTLIMVLALSLAAFPTTSAISYYVFASGDNNANANPNEKQKQGKKYLIVLHDKYDASYLEQNLIKLHQEERRRQRRLQQELEEESNSNSTGLRGGEYEQDEGSDIIVIDKEVHHKKVGKKSVQVQLLDGVAKLVTDIDGVVTVEEDSETWLSSGTVPSSGSQPTIVGNGKLWGLDRIDQSIGLNGEYVWDNVAEDIDIYIVDSGVYAAHDDFNGRVLAGDDFFNNPGIGGNSDCNSHGTHVASIAAGKTYGVAKRATIIPVRAVGCDGKGTVSALVNSVQYAIDTAQSRKRKGVINISLTAGFSDALNTAVKDAIMNGLVVAVAAGNSGGDACYYSPGSEASVLTVGGSSSDDSRLSISNYGSCVDIFAPGDSILAASFSGPSETMIKRGTSMASPNAAGVAAVIWSKNPTQSNAWVIDEIKRTGVKSRNIVDSDCEGKMSPDLLVNLKPRQSSQSTKTTSYLAQGQVLGSDFFDWPVDLSGKDGNLCVMFDAKIQRGASTGAPVLVAFASEAISAGIRAYQYAPYTCKITDFSNYDMYVQQGNPAMISKIGERIGTSLDGPTKFLSSRTAVSMYARIVRSGSVATVEIGTGSVPGEEVIVSARDILASKKPPMTRISFSSSLSFDVLYSNIRLCDDNGGSTPTYAPVATQKPTSPTKKATPSPTEVATTFAPTFDVNNGDNYTAVKRVAKGNFSKFWEYFGKNDNGDTRFCFEFNAKGKSNMLIALSETNTPFHIKNASNTYIVTIAKPKKTQNNVLSRGAEVISYSTTAQRLNTKTFTRYRIEMIDDTIYVREYYEGNDAGSLILSYMDQDIGKLLSPKYLSLSGQGKFDVIFEGIIPC